MDRPTAEQEVGATEAFTHQPFGHGVPGYNSSYDFDTLVMDLDETESDQLGGWDLASAVAHESGHWTQHHSTSIGAFLSAIRMAQMNLLEMLIQRAGHSNVDVYSHIIKVGPLVELNSKTLELVPSRLDDDPILASVRWSWTALQLVYSMFLDTDVGDVYGKTTIVEIATALVHADRAVRMHSFAEHGSNDTPGKELIELVIGRVSQDRTAVSTSQGQLISVRHLLEAHCLVAEAHLLYVDAWFTDGSILFPGRAMEDMGFRLADSGAVSKLFSDFEEYVRQCGFINVRQRDLYRTFLLLCDVALNPPLPPLVSIETLSSLPEGGLSVDSIHPVGRFYSLMRHLIVVGLYRGELEPDRMIEYEQDCCGAAGLVPLSAYRHGSDRLVDTLSGKDFDNFSANHETLLPQSKDTPVVNVHMWGTYLLWTQAQYWRHRSRILPSIIFGHGAKYSEEHAHTHLSELDPQKYWSEPMIRTNGRDKISSYHLNLAISLVSSAASSHAQFSFFYERNVSVALAYPPCLRWVAMNATYQLLRRLESSGHTESNRRG